MSSQVAAEDAAAPVVVVTEASESKSVTGAGDGVAPDSVGVTVDREAVAPTTPALPSDDSIKVKLAVSTMDSGGDGAAAPSSPSSTKRQLICVVADLSGEQGEEGLKKKLSTIMEVLESKLKKRRAEEDKDNKNSTQ